MSIARNEIFEKLITVSRKHSTSTVLFHHLLAERLGLNPTDLKCLDVIIQRSSLTAGQLADITGLTTGTITAVLDRLEKARFIRRVADPADRRKVLLEPITDRFAEFEGFWTDFLAVQAEILSQYTDEQLDLILDYLTKITAMLDDRADELRKKR